MEPLLGHLFSLDLALVSNKAAVGCLLRLLQGRCSPNPQLVEGGNGP